MRHDKPKRLSWKPVRRGTRYCSSACGGGCTYAAYLQAKKEGQALCRQLGPGWKPVVHENMGWHYRATLPLKGKNARFSVHHFGTRRYWADLHFGRQQFHCEGRTPLQAVRCVLEMAVAHQVNMARDLRAILGVVVPKDAPAKKILLQFMEVA